MVKPLKNPSFIHHSKHCTLLRSRQVFRFSSEPNFSSEFHLSSGRKDFSYLVSKVCGVLSGLQWQRSSELKCVSSEPTPQHVSRILEIHKDSETALQFFFWVSKRPFYKHSLDCFIVLLNRLLRDRLFAPANHVRILMIKACRNDEEITRVLGLLNEIGVKEYAFSLYTYNTLLIQLGKFEMVADVNLQLYQWIMPVKIICTYFLYYLNLQSLCMGFNSIGVGIGLLWPGNILNALFDSKYREGK